MGKPLDKKDLIKRILRELELGSSPEELMEKYRHVLETIRPEEILHAEQELVKEGIPRERIAKLCDVHLSIFADQLSRQRLIVPEGHPLDILMREHGHMLEGSQKLDNAFKSSDRLTEDGLKTARHLIDNLIEAESHYLREENALFPMLEKHGITEPPAIMWMEHDRIRRLKKELKKKSADPSPDIEELRKLARELRITLTNHFYKENNILFPTALKTLDTREWIEVRRSFDEIGYCCFTPPPMQADQEEEARIEERGRIQLETGSLTISEIESILNTLPLDLTFVDAEDTVRYFNNPPGRERIFIRTRAVLGRKVQNCHPRKSIHVVNKILDAFKKGERDVAEFWINYRGKFIYIRYFAVRDKSGKYLGTLEVTQDITDIKKIKGEKRLLDWK